MKPTIQTQIGRMHRKLDRLFQIKMKREMPVSILGGTTDVIHHFIFKSRSTFLRYCPKNAIPLTNGQHLELHMQGGVEAKIGATKGKKWLDWITEHKKVEYNPHRDKFYLEELKLLEKELAF